MDYRWRKASKSGAGNDCVELAKRPAGAIRDSKRPAAQLAVTIPALLHWVRAHG